MSQLMVSFRGHTPPRWLLDGVKRGRIPAVCLFAFNVSSPQQLRELTTQLYGAAKDGGAPPPLIGIDQEGGQLMAVAEGATALPGNMALGATRSSTLAEAAGRVLGVELLAMGCNLNFAPVLDINNNPDNPAVGLRSFGDDPNLVAELGAALIHGLQSAGVVATAKHFPGHGDIAADPHYRAAVVAKSREELETFEMVPFRAAMRAGVGAIMTAHVVYPAFDEKRPATISAAVGSYLRRDLAYEGLILTDALDMNALEGRSGRERTLAALEAGADLALLGHLPDQPELLEAAGAKADAASLARIQRVREGLPAALPPLEVVGSAEHRELAQTIADASITLVQDGGRLPLKPHDESRIAVVTVRPQDLTPADTSSAVKVRLAEAVKTRHRNTVAVEFPFQADDSSVRDALGAVAGADRVIVGTLAADRDPGQANFVKALHARGQRPIVVALRTPYDLRAFPEIETYLCAYGIREATTEAVARVLFGEIKAGGRLPCLLDLPSRSEFVRT